MGVLAYVQSVAVEATLGLYEFATSYDMPRPAGSFHQYDKWIREYRKYGSWGYFYPAAVRMGQLQCVPVKTVPLPSTISLGSSSMWEDFFPSTPREVS